jgi:hypothetical protein
MYLLVPATIVIFLVVACVKGNMHPNVVTAVEPVRMNVLYIGVDNPIRIAASGYQASDLTVSIDNGIITGENGEYTIRPKQLNKAIVTVSSHGKEIQKSTFRVKSIPDPVLYVGGKRGGNVDKDFLMKQQEVKAQLENFDFDASFDIVEFTVSATLEGFTKDIISKSGKITPEQRDLIFAKLKPGIAVIFQDIKCKGPDGIVRSISPIAFKCN